MGSFKTRFGYWSDAGQDAVDDYLVRRYDLESVTTRSKKLTTYRRAIKDKKMFKAFSDAHRVKGFPAPTMREFKHHVAVGVALTHTGLLSTGDRKTWPKLPGGVRVRRHKRKQSRRSAVGPPFLPHGTLRGMKIRTRRSR